MTSIINNEQQTYKLFYAPLIKDAVRDLIWGVSGPLLKKLGDTGHEFWREREVAMELGWTQRQFNDYMNNPAFYRIELPSNNRSHRFELRGYNVLGD